MTLMAGTTVQNDQIVIEAILHQSDFGVTYQAKHVSLNRPLILQSFNEALRQRSDFEALRQKFWHDVLVLDKQPSDSVQVVYGFEENGMPFVVLKGEEEAIASQSVPPLSDWLEIPLEAPASEQPPEQPPEQAPEQIPEPAQHPEAAPTQAAALAAALATAFPEVETPKVEMAAIPVTDAEELAPTLEAAPTPEAAPTHVPFTAPSSPKVNVFVAEPAKPKKFMPLALMMTALITGFGGIGLGLALRFEPTPKGSDNTSGLSTGWFGREQNFPPKQEWPITETPSLYPPTTTFEQPVYQSSPPVSEYGVPRLQSPAPDYMPPTYVTPPPSYQPTPGIADYPPTTPAPETETDPAEAAPVPEPSQPDLPLPEPITPEAPLEIAPEAAPQPASPKDVPSDEPIIFHQ